MLLWLGLAAALFLRGWLAWTLPYDDAPDEDAHAAMVRYLAAECRPPTMADVPTRVPVSYPALCPLGYVPAALFQRWAPAAPPDSFRWARLGSVLAGVGVVALGYAAARLLRPEEPTLAWATLAVLAVHPQFIFLTAVTNNDALMIFWSSAVVVGWLRVARQGWTLRGAAVLGVLSALAFLSKSNSLGAAAFAGPILLARGWSLRTAPRGEQWAEARRLVAFLAAGVVTILPWCVWSLAHHGSLTGIDVHRDWWFDFVAQRGGQPRLNAANFLWFAARTWESCWATFGYQEVTLPRPLYLVLLALAGVSMVGVLLSLRQGAAVDRITTLACLAAVGGVLLSHLVHSRHFGLAPQGRYLAAATVPLALLFVAGWLSFASVLAASVGRGRVDWSRWALLVPVLAAAGLAALSGQAIRQHNALPAAPVGTTWRVQSWRQPAPGGKVPDSLVVSRGTAEPIRQGTAYRMEAPAADAGVVRFLLPAGVSAARITCFYPETVPWVRFAVLDTQDRTLETWEAATAHAREVAYTVAIGHRTAADRAPATLTLTFPAASRIELTGAGIFSR